VNVDVDKTGTDDALVSVDHRVRVCPIQTAYRGNLVSSYGNIRAKGGTAAATVNNVSILDDTVKSHILVSASVLVDWETVLYHVL
jgi:hypothetical protein